jgi:hypothetical protein
MIILKIGSIIKKPKKYLKQDKKRGYIYKNMQKK